MPKGTVYIETFGCQMNVADTERAATRLREAGYAVAGEAAAADVILFNTCSVRARAEQKVFNRVGEVRKNEEPGQPALIGVMGCVAQLEGEKVFTQAPSVSFVAGTRATDRLPSLIARVLQGERKVLDLGERGPDNNWDVAYHDRKSPHVAFVPIIEGCNKFCTYCIVPYSRGREQSRTPAEVLDQIKELKAQGVREVQLIGQNVNSYRPRNLDGLEGFSGATPFSRMLRAVAATGIERVKFTTSFPRDFHPDIVTALEEYENLCDWVHLPVQSGSDSILRAMRRGHKVADYLEKVTSIKKSRRRLALTSDIIVGFPGETEQDFTGTLRLVEQCEFDSLYIFKYSERSGTPAAKMLDDVSEQEKTVRFLELEKMQRSKQRKVLQGYVGRDVRVLVEGTSTRAAEDWKGHSTCQKVVNFKGQTSAGEIVPVLVTEAKENSLYGVQMTAAVA